MKIITNDMELFAYSFDASQSYIKPKAVAIANTYQDIKDSLEYAKKAKLKLLARGSATNLVGNAVSDGLLLDMCKLNKVFDFDPKNKTVCVQAGIVVNDLNIYLKQYNFMFPVIPSSYKEATIGGMISCNAAGRQALKYGATKDWIEEITIMTAGKEQMVLRGNDIYDIVGSEGRYAIILEAKLKLIEIPKKRTLDLLEFSNVTELATKINDIRSKNPTSIELINKKAAEFLNKKANYYLFIEYDDDTGYIKKPEEIEESWALRDDTYPVLAQKGFHIIEDPKAMDNETLIIILEFCEKNKIPAFGHVGIGILHPCFRHDQKELIDKLYELVIKHGCQITGEHGYGIKKLQYISDTKNAEISSLKQKYDPEDIIYTPKENERT